MQAGIYQISTSTGTSLLDHCAYKPGVLFRLKGLLGKKKLSPGHGILLSPCNSIHMFFMAFAIDAVFLDKQHTVLHILHGIKPWRISPIILQAHAVVEGPVGFANGLALGDQLLFKKLEEL